MPLNIDAIAALALPDAIHELTHRDTILYALGLGYGEDPLNTRELRFVFEQGLKPVPSVANILCHPGFWAQEPRYGIDWVKLLHAEQAFVIHSPIPPVGKIRGVTRILGIEDKGAGKGALVHQTKELHDEADGTHLATVRQTLMLRGNGGEGAFGKAQEQPGDLPKGEPQAIVEIPTRPGLALLYRLNGDWNPLHANPAVATKAGFDRPILHGMCTLGLAARAIIQHFCDYDPDRLKAMFVRFSRPVMPGETLRFEFFEDAPGKLRFRASVAEREVVVLDRCQATVG